MGKSKTGIKARKPRVSRAMREAAEAAEAAGRTSVGRIPINQRGMTIPPCSGPCGHLSCALQRGDDAINPVSVDPCVTHLCRGGGWHEPDCPKGGLPSTDTDPYRNRRAEDLHTSAVRGYRSGQKE